MATGSPYQRALAGLACAATALLLLVLPPAVSIGLTHILNGDEPHFLIMVDAFVRQGSFDLKAEYTQQLYPAVIDSGRVNPHVLPMFLEGDKAHWYPIHGIGLPLLLTPFWVLGGITGVFIAMAAIGMVGLLLAFVFALRVTGSLAGALFAALAIGLSLTFLGLERAIYPDLLIAALLLGALVILETAPPQPWRYLLLGSLLAVMIWVHFKTLPVATALLGLAAYHLWRDRREISPQRVGVVLLAPLLLSFIAFEVVNHNWYGTFSPLALESGQPGFQSPLVALPAILFDSYSGFFINNPVFAIALAGLPMWLAVDRGRALRTLAVVAVPAGIVVSYQAWHGGAAPPNRYEMDFAPALAPAFAVALVYVLRSVAAKVVATAVVLAQAAYSFFYLRIPGTPEWAPVPGAPNPFWVWFDQLHGTTIARFIRPVVPPPDYSALRWLYIGGLAAILVMCLGIGAAVALRRAAPVPTG